MEPRETSIQLIRNATLKIEYAGKIILFDPMLSEAKSFMSFVDPSQNLNPTVDLPFSIGEVLEGVDFVLLSHVHPDHWDPEAMDEIGKNMMIACQPVDLQGVKEVGFSNALAIEDERMLEGISITRVEGKHGPEGLLEELGRVSGYVLKAEGLPTIYLVSDCLLDQDVQNAVETHKPDIIVVNAGGALFMGENRILMDEYETISLAKLAPKAKLMVVHLESLDHCHTTRKSMKEKADAAGVEVIIPKDGEKFIF
ncbi:MBL fold metallo-hydrolase [Aureibacter tunicatorum]|uniref:L-ascorbate metabolism protein UlaG (Beta-lactamase superfamily) n=1 Tax=Aureibacter tunicatorum TaxID=866807 RepID=A0AAE4BQV2_9BACT|nr:MBL fold metallo-hydrolase [Aureibacter tunicatorum]MDR6237298.1 L-ascorbate metabolism protein UlaG (beta-lactamase superfamily) [Aureibacter tunicatorum]BDD06289.1 hypothetical protein AUTU_37720 [Aureibacter tunicatorum]